MTEELFQRFFGNECTPEEERLVREYLRRHWANLENELSEQDWAAFGHKDSIPPVISEKMLSVIDNSIHTKKTRRIYFRWASAAALILFGLAAWKWTTWHQHTETGNGPAIVASLPPLLHEWKEQINNTGRSMALTLPDNSKVELADKSSIRYVDSFTTANRTIYLKGKALFNVTADRQRPFTVYAGRLSTTALGTVFSVSWSGDSSAAMEVRLHSGKVVIRPDSLLHSRGIRDTYLDPGQQLKFDPLQLTVHVERAKPAIAHIEKPKIEDVLKFNDTPLPGIFSTLEKQFHCKFDYKKEEVDDIRFTGNFNTKKETLSDFLNTIALLNNLTLSEKNNTYYLR